MFNIGDIVTGTPENKYGITSRGVICEVIGYVENEPDDMVIEIISVDEELAVESCSSLVKRRVPDGTFDKFIHRTYTVHKNQFELYAEQASVASISDDLIDFVNSV